MRNKPNQLAVIVRTAECDAEHLNKVVRVVALRIAMGELAWQVSPPCYWTNERGQQMEIMWDDRDLQPIKPDAKAFSISQKLEVPA